MDSNDSHVMLIKKAKPEWQKGHLNGIGGKIEPGETPTDCMFREFSEETGIAIPSADWLQFATGYITCHQGNCICHYFIARTLAPHHMVKPRQDDFEQAQWVAIQDLCKQPIIPNICWLIPMGLIKLATSEWQEQATFVTH